ncbi:MAG: hypothetical protein NZ899_03130 [Thermoguttaceae bacterium]|nr:hypothetical protein [Thermoguttaceae bacterium]MDW8078892.1 hypothetical protein [Thermoguttaceae bacterium]
MAQTIDSFISRLRAEGVDAAKKEAEEIKRQAQQEAEEILRSARAEAERILAETERQRKITLERTRTDLELAARDVVGYLRATLNKALTALLAKAVEAAFSDPEFLRQLILQVVREYAAADLRQQAPLTIRIPADAQEKLRDWLLVQFHQLAGTSKSADFAPEVVATLNKAGFEYKVSAGTVEVTSDSVVQLLKEILTPELQGIIDKAITSESPPQAASA